MPSRTVEASTAVTQHSPAAAPQSGPERPRSWSAARRRGRRLARRGTTASPRRPGTSAPARTSSRARGSRAVGIEPHLGHELAAEVRRPEVELQYEERAEQGEFVKLEAVGC